MRLARSRVLPQGPRSRSRSACLRLRPGPSRLQARTPRAPHPSSAERRRRVPSGPSCPRPRGSGLAAILTRVAPRGPDSRRLREPPPPPSLPPPVRRGRAGTRGEARPPARPGLRPGPPGPPPGLRPQSPALLPPPASGSGPRRAAHFQPRRRLSSRGRCPFRERRRLAERRGPSGAPRVRSPPPAPSAFLFFVLGGRKEGHPPGSAGHPCLAKGSSQDSGKRAPEPPTREMERRSPQPLAPRPSLPPSGPTAVRSPHIREAQLDARYATETEPGRRKARTRRWKTRLML